MNSSSTHPRVFTLPERVHIAKTLKTFGLGYVRLPGITTGPACLGFQHGCTCGCTSRPLDAPVVPVQPWTPKAARHQQKAA